MGIRYKDIITTAKLFTFGLKTIDFRFSKYDRSDDLNSYIFSLGTTFVGIKAATFFNCKFSFFFEFIVHKLLHLSESHNTSDV